MKPWNKVHGVGRAEVESIYRESKTLEKKSSFAAWKEIAVSLSAFANKECGKVDK
jgi:hypothetical protein